MKTVAILGCGPAGMLAAHAVRLSGHTPVIFSSSAEPSPISGAQYLHRPIPDAEVGEPFDITYLKLGTRDGYAQKVYGDAGAPCSWDVFAQGDVQAWSLRRLYDALWHQYGDRIVPEHIGLDVLRELLATFPLVISTIPLHHICEGFGHRFPEQRIWLRHGPPPGERIEYAEDEPGMMIARNAIVYSGDPSHAWYRQSIIDGEQWSEFSHPVGDAREGFKPLDTDCNCHPEIVRAGRFGEWRRGVLTHNAFEAAARAVAVRLNGADD